MRDRFIELLCDIECNGEDWNNGGCALRKNERCIKIDNLDMCMIGCIADNLLANGVIVPPCKVGDKVYHIAKCDDFHAELDGTLYDSLGGIGSATGYYCPCELRNNCPFDDEEEFECENQKSKLAIFEDEVNGFIIGKYEETIILLYYTGNEYMHNFGKTVFLTREEAEKALAERSAE